MWLEGFAQNISEDTEVRGLVGISDAQCTELTELAKAFHEKLFIANSPSSNTSPNVEAKTLARNAVVIATAPFNESITIKKRTPVDVCGLAHTRRAFRAFAMVR